MLKGYFFKRPIYGPVTCLKSHSQWLTMGLVLSTDRQRALCHKAIFVSCWGRFDLLLLILLLVWQAQLGKTGVFAFIFISVVAEYYLSVKLYQLLVFIIINYILFIFNKFKNQVKNSVLSIFVKIISPFWCTVFFLKVRNIDRIKSTHHYFQPAQCCFSSVGLNVCRALLLGSIHCIFHATGHHYTWKKVTTTVHNIIVGKLWIDQVSKGPLRASEAQKCPHVHLCRVQDMGPGPRLLLLLCLLPKGFLSGSNHTPSCWLAVPPMTICKWPGHCIHSVTALLGLG